MKLEHIAIIMDGNGRWAQARLHRRVWGHIRGSSVVSQIVEESSNLNLKTLTLYAFSTENWSRPADEINILFSLLKKFLMKEASKLIKNNVRFKVIGDYSKLPSETIGLIREMEEKSKNYTGLKFNLAFGYGSRDEILKAVNKHITNNPGKSLDEATLASNLDLSDSGDVDLLIRTGGDQRISNFLLWQCAYAEFFFTKTKWPDFSIKEYRQIILDVSERERRFGTVSNPENFSQAKKMASENKKLLKPQARS